MAILKTSVMCLCPVVLYFAGFGGFWRIYTAWLAAGWSDQKREYIEALPQKDGRSFEQQPVALALWVFCIYSSLFFVVVIAC